MKRLSPVVTISAVIILLGASVWWVGHRSPVPAAGTASPIVVTTATVGTQDVPVWLSGLGSVQASQTVTLRPKVSGELITVNFTEGQAVKAGDIIAQIDPRPYQSALAGAQALQTQAQARLANDRSEFERSRSLVAAQTESPQILEQRTSTLGQSTALAQAAQASIDTAQLQLDFTTLRAPINGITGIRLIDAGNLVAANQTPGVVIITQTQPITVVFTLPQHQFQSIRRGLSAAAPAALPVEALSDHGEVLARGQLDLIDNQFDPSTGTLRLKATFPNTDLALWPGQFVTARVLTETLSQAVTIPSEAIQPGLNGLFVYVVKPDSTVEARSLTTGLTVKNLTTITAGLTVGEVIVREGQNKLKPTARVTVAPSLISPSATPASR